MSALELTPEQVAALTPEQRVQRVERLVGYAYDLMATAITEHFTNAGREVAGIAVLFSGGNDSTVLAHLFRDVATVAIHANTGIGIEATRQFVRDTCTAWSLPLIEKHPPAGSTYEELVIDQGFPGPAHHWKMYQRLKERALRQARAELVVNPRRQRVLFVAGRRRNESERRADIPEVERIDATVWLSPLAHWTAIDMNTYRRRHPDVPENQTSKQLHMSGECLCGAFAQAGELDEVRFWYPEVAEHIEALEAKVLAAGRCPAWKARWGWGADKATIQRMVKDGMSAEDIAAQFTRSKSGPLCSTCAVLT